MTRLARREFIKGAASLVAAGGMAHLAGCGSSAHQDGPTPAAGSMPERSFGRTGVQVGIFGLGGQAALEQAGQEGVAERIIDRALALGVSYFDTAALYGGGRSERSLGRVLSSRRQDAFLATKTLARSYDGAMRDLERSLANLRTDHVDLWQVHSLGTQDELDAILGVGGALEAFQQALSEGTTRFVGVTGHYDPDVIANAITSYDFDAVLMALNAADVHDRSFVRDALPAAVDRQMGVVAMKVPARGRLFQEGGVTSMAQALGYALTHPVSTAIIGCSTVSELEENVALARAFEPLPGDEMRRLEGLTAPYHREATWFKY